MGGSGRLQDETRGCCLGLNYSEIRIQFEDHAEKKTKQQNKNRELNNTKYLWDYCSCCLQMGRFSGWQCKHLIIFHHLVWWDCDFGSPYLRLLLSRACFLTLYESAEVNPFISSLIWLQSVCCRFNPSFLFCREEGGKNGDRRCFDDCMWQQSRDVVPTGRDFKGLPHDWRFICLRGCCCVIDSTIYWWLIFNLCTGFIAVIWLQHLSHLLVGLQE